MMNSGIVGWNPHAHPQQLSRIVQKPISKMLLDAFRAEFHRLIDGEDFQENLLAIRALAENANSVAITLSMKTDASPAPAPGTSLGVWPSGAQMYAGDVTGIGIGYGGSNPEQFGAKAIRELVANAPAIAEAIMKAPNESPAAIVDAIKRARDAGLEDLAKRLEDGLVERAWPASLEPEQPEPPQEPKLNGVSHDHDLTVGHGG